MNLRVIGALAASAVLLSGCGGAATVPPAQSGARTVSALERELALGRIRPACAPVAVGAARCLAYVLTAGGRAAMATSAQPAASIAGLTPAQLQSAYDLTGAVSGGSGQTVAIVVAYNDPDAAADLAVYRSRFGLPACTVASGCLKIVGEHGGSSLPANNASWGQEISLDLDMVSANCPKCSILLVEATTASTSDLATAENTAAAAKGVAAIANSYGGSESSSETAYAASYSHAGVAITAAGNGGGYGVQVPAAYATVASVGGTTLTADAGTKRGWTETGLAGGGCSAYIAKPSFQTDPYCGTKRIDNDVAYVADPSTGVAVYDSYADGGESGWLVFGGTSVGAPAIAAIYALSGDTTGAPATLYSRASMLYHVPCISGSACYGTYDPATGNGTPDGTGAF